MVVPVRGKCLILLALGLVALGLMAPATPAGADPAGANSGISSSSKWRAMDGCGKESFQKFPDYTTEASAKRDAFMRDCLQSKNLPPRASESSRSVAPAK